MINNLPNKINYALRFRFILEGKYDSGWWGAYVICTPQPLVGAK